MNMKLLRAYREWRSLGFRRRDALALAVKYYDLGE